MNEIPGGDLEALKHSGDDHEMKPIRGALRLSARHLATGRHRKPGLVKVPEIEVAVLRERSLTQQCQFGLSLPKSLFISERLQRSPHSLPGVVV